MELQWIAVKYFDIIIVKKSQIYVTHDCIINTISYTVSTVSLR